MPALGKFSRSVLIILTGTLAAQTISVLVSPILTRFYSPGDFGVFALFVSIVSLSGAVAGGRYELGITLPADERKGLALLALCSGIAVAFSVLLVTPAIVVGQALTSRFGEPRVGVWIWCVPVAVLLTGFSTAARYWMLRRKDFRAVSANGVLRTAVGAGFNVTFGFVGWTQFGLIGGLLIGMVVEAVFFATRIWRASSAEIRSLQWSDVRTQAYEQRRFPLFSTGSALVESGSAQVPVFLLGSLFGVTPLGHFSLAQRVASLPLSLVANSVADVFRQQASETYAREAACLRLYDRTFKRLFWASLPVLLLVGWLSPSIFGLVFGARWQESGTYVRLLLPALALRFVSSPLSSMFYIAGRQVTDLGIQVALLLSMLGAFWWAARAGSGWGPRDAVTAYAAIYSVKYLTELGLSRRYARGLT
jgi:O-antigen/teichoic acid export membrane protein